jgi:excisionase family DNA binding protein
VREVEAQEQRLMTVEELARILNVPKSWIYDRTRQGQEAIPHIKLGLYVRFDLGEVIRFFKNKKHGVL